MTILVTGASGFLGSHIVEQLSQAGRPVRALVRRTSDLRHLEGLPGVELAFGSMSDKESLVQACAGVEAVVHSAGLVKARSAEEFRRVNAGGTENILAAVLESGAKLRRFVLVSSLTALGPVRDPNVPAERPDAPVTDYGRSKLEAESTAKTFADRVPLTILRPGGIYGPRDREILAVFQAVKYRVLPLLTSPNTIAPLVYGPDCAAACVAAIDAELPTGTTLYVDDGERHRFADIAAAAEAALGVRTWLRFQIPGVVLGGAALVSELAGRVQNKAVMLSRKKLPELTGHWVYDSSKTQSALGWTPRVGLEEGARLTVAWYKQHGWL